MVTVRQLLVSAQPMPDIGTPHTAQPTSLHTLHTKHNATVDYTTSGQSIKHTNHYPHAVNTSAAASTQRAVQGWLPMQAVVGWICCYNRCLALETALHCCSRPDTATLQFSQTAIPRSPSHLIPVQVGTQAAVREQVQEQVQGQGRELAAALLLLLVLVLVQVWAPATGLVLPLPVLASSLPPPFSSFWV